VCLFKRERERERELCCIAGCDWRVDISSEDFLLHSAHHCMDIYCSTRFISYWIERALLSFLFFILFFIFSCTAPKRDWKKRGSSKCNAMQRNAMPPPKVSRDSPLLSSSLVQFWIDIY
jgi:hypothetical protein